jgi:hypothetical protein
MRVNTSKHKARMTIALDKLNISSVLLVAISAGDAKPASADITAPKSGADALLESSEGWGRLAACITADIPQQPKGLHATLRDYQMHVSTSVICRSCMAHHAHYKPCARDPPE